jgi:hypothetical protein
MLFNKRLTELGFSDIKELKDKQIEESEILDYKEIIDDDNSVLREVAAFSNGRGGYLIYGIKESGRGAKGSGRGSYPEAIIGIDKSYNCERLEQLIIGNIIPRVSVQFHKIQMPDPNKIILVIHIPEGQNKPYYSVRGQKYFKRYNFEATPMVEHEIEAMYRERFFGVSNLSRYVNEAISFNRNFIPLEKRSEMIDCHIIVSPLRIEDRIIDTTDGMKIGRELRESSVNVNRSSRYIAVMEEPSKYGIKWADKIMDQIVEVHRNGLVYCMCKCGGLDDEKLLKFYERDFGNYLLNTILFADTVYSKFEFVGKVKIIAKIINCANSEIYIPIHQIRRDFNKCGAEEITIEREWDSWKLKDDYMQIGKSIMDEAANCYGFWNSGYLIEKEGSIQFVK